MQAYGSERIRQLGTWAVGAPVVRLLSGDGAAALLAPFAMLAAALGLLVLWSVSAVGGQPVVDTLSAEAVALLYPRAEAVIEAPPPPASVIEVQVHAAVLRDRALGGALQDLGAPMGIGAAGAAAVSGPQTPAQRLAEIRGHEEALIRGADHYARRRAERLRRAYGLAGIDWRPFSAGDVGSSAASLTVAELRSTKALAARFDISRGLARRIQRTAHNLIEARALEGAVAILPLGLPTLHAVKSSNFGYRIDPFTGDERFHPGVDFAGRFGQAIRATGPGVVSFAGVRNGYGNCVEIDHGNGFKTRYGHMSAIAVHVGQTVLAGARLGAMGSTGRSTGVHVHYEVWQNNRLTDPMRFLTAGTEVRRALADLS